MDRPPGPLPRGLDRGQLLAEVASSLVHLVRGATACIALSGGPDSTALAYLTAEARPDLRLALVHVRHGLRDDDEDRAVVAGHATWLGLPLVEREVTVTVEGKGLEAAARDARYAALRTVAGECGACAILVGHTADDLAETVLLRLARGTGLGGLAAMQPVAADDVVRPLLRVRRADVHRFVTLEGLPTVADPTNTDPAVRRSLVRYHLLPLLERIAGDPVGALGRLAGLAHDDAAALDAWAHDVARAARRAGPALAIPDEALEHLPPAVRRRVVRWLVQQVDDGPPPTAAAVETILTQEPGTAGSLPGALEVTAAAGWRTVAPAHLPRVEPRTVAVPGTTVWEPAGLQLLAITPGAAAPELGRGGERPPRPRHGGARADPDQIALDLPGAWTPPEVAPDPRAVPPGGRADRLHVVLPPETAPLVVRHRKPGDRLRLPSGTRKLKEVLIDVGVPRAVRAVWPVVTQDDRVIWVPGVAADAALVRAGRREPGIMLVVTSAPAEAVGDGRRS